MPFSDAVRFVRTEERDELVTFSISALQRDIALRGASTDPQCFRKVFIKREYDGPPRASSPRLIVDAGANIGMATLFYRMRFPYAKIIAIEPETENFALLQRNCSSVPNITMIQAALWSTGGEKLSVTNPGAGAWGFRTEPDSVTKGPLIETISIDDVLERSGLTEIDILKIDIEGAEREIFSAHPAWLRRVSSIVIELHDRFLPGCARTFYSALVQYDFTQDIRGENIFIDFYRQSGGAT